MASAASWDIKIKRLARQRDRANQEHPVDRGHINLTNLSCGGMPDVQTRQVSQPDCLAGQGKGATDDSLGSNDGRQGGQQYSRNHGPGRNHGAKRMPSYFRPVHQQGSLPKIIHYQGGKDQGKPGQANGFFPEMPHIRIKCLSSGNHQENGAQHYKPLQPVGKQKPDCVPRENSSQHLRSLEHLHCPGNSQKTDPKQDYRPEKRIPGISCRLSLQATRTSGTESPSRWKG